MFSSLASCFECSINASLLFVKYTVALPCVLIIMLDEKGCCPCGQSKADDGAASEKEGCPSKEADDGAASEKEVQLPPTPAAQVMTREVRLDNAEAPPAAPREADAAESPLVVE